VIVRSLPKSTLLRAGACALMLLLCGCSAANLGTQQFSPSPGFQAVLHDDNLQGSYFRTGRSTTVVCLLPDPDVAQSRSDGFSFALAGGESAGVDDATRAAALGGRNPEVLVARELMYRACELSSNLDADYEQTRSIYTEFLTAITDIARYQRGAGSAASSNRDRDDDDDDDDERDEDDERDDDNDERNSDDDS